MTEPKRKSLVEKDIKFLVVGFYPDGIDMPVEMEDGDTRQDLKVLSQSVREVMALKNLNHYDREGCTDLRIMKVVETIHNP